VQPACLYNKPTHNPSHFNPVDGVACSFETLVSSYNTTRTHNLNSYFACLIKFWLSFNLCYEGLAHARPPVSHAVHAAMSEN
jgi:hypothetical protein